MESIQPVAINPSEPDECLLDLLTTHTLDGIPPKTFDMADAFHCIPPHFWWTSYRSLARQFTGTLGILLF
jgi:hypothetical protein